MFSLGVIGDYWPDPNSNWVGAGFLFEFLGMLVLGVGSILYGMATIQGMDTLRESTVPRWVGYGLIGIAPLGVLGSVVLKHIPSGPLFGYVVFWLIVGVRSIWKPHEN